MPPTILALRPAPHITQSTADALLGQLTKFGYCYVSHPALPPERLKNMTRISRLLFHQYLPRCTPDELEIIKTSSHTLNTVVPGAAMQGGDTNPCFRGLYNYVGASGKLDNIYCFSYGKEVDEPAALRETYYTASGWEKEEFYDKINRRNPTGILRGDHLSRGGAHLPPVFHSNSDPAHVALGQEIAAALQHYYSDCHIVSMDILRHIALALGIRSTDHPVLPAQPDSGSVDLDFFTRAHQRADCNLELKYYPDYCSPANRKNIYALAGTGRLTVQLSANTPQGAATSAPRVLRRHSSNQADEQRINKLPAQAAGVRGAEQSSAVDDLAGDEALFAASRLRLETHKDLSTVTLLLQDRLGGLQVWEGDDDDGRYVPVPVLADEAGLLVNAGVFLEKWTGGGITATPHRVVRGDLGGGDAALAAPAGDRHSIVFFTFPDFDAMINPLTCSSEYDPDAPDDAFLAGDLMPML